MSHIPATMAAVLLTGHGGPECLRYRTDVPVPRPGDNDVLIKVLAAGVNNTDINTRVGWYSQKVTEATAAQSTSHDVPTDDAAWTGTPMVLPRIQGADCCGRIVAVGQNVNPSRLGERVIVRTMMRAPVNFRPFETVTLGSEYDGGFAEYCVAPDGDCFAVNSTITDIELGAMPCAYSTALNLLHQSKLVAGETVIIAGASGGVGLAAVQLAHLRGARVFAMAASNKADAIRQHGAHAVIDRDEDPRRALGGNTADVVIDVVAGPSWPRLIDALKPGGRYAVSGAIAGPIVTLDVRKLYLRDLTFHGCTVQHDSVLPALVRHIEHDALRPVIARTFPLSEIAAAQAMFMEKSFIGKIVLVPPLAA